jgi:orotidine-5'-phosphate decarboxylase
MTEFRFALGSAPSRSVGGVFPTLGLCLGIDPVAASVHGFETALAAHERVLEALVERQVCCPLKPNLAFFLRHGSRGVALLEAFCLRWQNKMPVLLDAKFGEIANTLDAYLDFAFQTLGAQSLTLNPFLGEGTIHQAAVKCLQATAGMGRIYVLCATSQHSVSALTTLQDARAIIAACANVRSELLKSCPQGAEPLGLVIGANRTDVLGLGELTDSGLPVLSPGLGAQGADWSAARRAAEPLRVLFPQSRSLFGAGSTPTAQSLARIDAFLTEMASLYPDAEVHALPASVTDGRKNPL